MYSPHFPKLAGRALGCGLGIVLAGAGFAWAGTKEGSPAELTLYSHRHYEADDALLARFTELSGIRVRVVKAGAEELAERLAAEGERSPADVFMTADAGNLERAKAAGLLQAVKSGVLEEAIPPHLRDPEGYWHGFSQRARVLVYAPGRVREGELATYEDLAQPRWRGRILSRSSANIYNQSLLASLIAANGEDAAQAWTAAVRKNLARPPQGSDRDQIRAVAAGLGDVAIVNTYYLGLMEESEDPKDREAAAKVKVFFPNQEGRGVHVNVSGAGVTRSSRQPEAATRLLEFLASQEAQAVFARANSEYPVSQAVPWTARQEAWGRFKADTLPLGRLGELNAAAVRMFNRAGWE